ncbi:MAG: hypothetical protein LC708_04250, partial [Actinobacteria bacterium]|nr:hypothetical protein [Actinomycetota bacterium]
MALLGGAVLTLHAAGAALPGPPLLRPSSWPRWAAGRDPVVVAFAVVRLLALVAAWYGLVVTVAGVALRVAPAAARGPVEHLASVVDRLTVGPLRRVVAATVAVGISTGPLAAAGAGPLPAQGPGGPLSGM